MDFHTIFSPSYWFTVNPANITGPVGYAAIGVFAAMIIAGIVVRIRRGNKKTNPLRARRFEAIARMLSTMGLIGIVLAFFSYENIRLLGARFWYVLWVLGAIIWIVWIVRMIRRTAPASHTDIATQYQKEKYLPKPKHR